MSQRYSRKCSNTVIICLIRSASINKAELLHQFPGVTRTWNKTMTLGAQKGPQLIVKILLRRMLPEKSQNVADRSQSYRVPPKYLTGFLSQKICKKHLKFKSNFQGIFGALKAFPIIISRQKHCMVHLKM